MRATRPVLLWPMAIFGVLGTGLLLYFLFAEGQGPVYDNLVPELIGFCLEGFFLVGLLTLLQNARERAYRKELWLSLRGSLRGILSNLDIAFLPPNAEPTDTVRLERDPVIVGRFMRELQFVHLDLDSMVALKKESIDALAMVRDMVPVAAQLSASHMRWWIAIVQQIRQLAGAQTRDDVEHSAYTLLESIQEFDRLAY